MERTFIFGGFEFKENQIHLGMGKYNHLRVFFEGKFSFIESKRGYGKFSKKSLNRIIDNLKNKRYIFQNSCYLWK